VRGRSPRGVELTKCGPVETVSGSLGLEVGKIFENEVKNQKIGYKIENNCDFFMILARNSSFL